MAGYDRGMAKLMTIGELAKRAKLRPSALRYYEEQGLLKPDGRTESGYRLYGPLAEKNLQLIQRAQHLGLSLEDIRRLLAGYQRGELSDAAIIQIVEARAMTLERQLTELLVFQHELDHFLQDIRPETHAPHPATHTGSDHFDQLLQRICGNPHTQTARNWLDWLIDYAGCQLHSQTGQDILQKLEGQHIHIWREDNGYHILLVNDDPALATALHQLADLEATCEAPAHADLTISLHQDTEGHHLIVRGDNAFIYARLFLALEQSEQVS